MEKRDQTRGRSVIRIAITGPESTGKSQLTWQLARHYGGRLVREVARSYVADLGRDYNYFDLLVMAKKQIHNQLQGEKLASGFLFCDTELTVLKIWSEHCFGKNHPWVLKKIKEINYDLYLLCDIDLPWKFDPLREHPHKRLYFFNKYYEELASRSLPFKVIRGKGNERLQNAVQAIDSYFGL